jgi:putative tricarboxylic transport membrane protein
MEFRLREAMAISRGEVSGLWSEPLAVVIYVVVALAVVAPLVIRRVRPAPAAVAADEGIVVEDDTEEKVR